MEPDRDEEHSSAAEEPSEPQENLTLPAIAAKADDLEEIKKAVEDAASVSGGLWLSYLFVLSYIAIAAGAVTHEDLLLVRPVKLPFLNVELPLLAFFALAPFAVLIIHAYALMHFIMLGKKASHFHNELRRQFPDSETKPQKSGAVPDGAHKEIRDKLRRLLPSNIFVQILAGPPELRTDIFGSMLKLIAVTTLVVFPILLLLLLQIQFLPFHDVTITWAQRGTLFLDIVLLWLLRPPILADLSVDGAGRSLLFAGGLRGLGLGLAVVMSLLALWFSTVVATIPDEWPETALARLDRSQWRLADVAVVSTHGLLFAGEVDETTRRRKSLFSNTLVLPGFNLYEALKIDDPKKLTWKEHLFDLRGRHLEGAVFTGANLAKADLSGAYLEDASFDTAQLQGASLSRARLQGSSLFWTQLQGASLTQAQLQGTSLMFTQLQGASLPEAQLQGTYLMGVQLAGASLDRAQLQGAFLGTVTLCGASLFRAQLQGAWLVSSHLWGASLEGAQLQGAQLLSNFEAANMSKAFVWRAFGEPSSMAGILASELTWGPQSLDESGQSVPWTQEKYRALREAVKTSVPPSDDREQGWRSRQIEILDCDKERYAPFPQEVKEGKDHLSDVEQTPRADEIPPDEISVDLASCDPKAEPPASVAKWRREVEKAGVGNKTHIKDVAIVLGEVVCEGKSLRDLLELSRTAMTSLVKEHVSAFAAAGLAEPWAHQEFGAIHVLHGLLANGRFEATGVEAPALAARILSKDCPVSASLTDDDKARLLQIKQSAEQKSAPSPASKKAK